MKKVKYSSIDGTMVDVSKIPNIDRYVCTKYSPWTKNKSLWATHPDLIETSEALPGDVGIIHLEVKGFKCLNCNHMWYEYYE